MKTKTPEPPVAYGEAWRCGAHLYLCSDLMDQDETTAMFWKKMTEGSFDAGERIGVWPRPTLVYTDPPWGQALANGFRTKAGLGRAAYHWTDIYARIAHLAFWLDIPVWYEGPEASTADGLLVPAAIRAPEDDRATHRLYRGITYMGGKPSGLYYCAPVPPPAPYHLISTAGFAVVAETLAHYPPGVLLDPCSGLGGIALEGEKQDWMSVNNELNPQRMARALARMADATGAVPERIA